MKFHISITGSDGGWPRAVHANLHVTYESEWQALDMNDIDRMKDFHIGVLCYLRIFDERGNGFVFIPATGPPPAWWERLLDYFVDHFADRHR